MNQTLDIFLKDARDGDKFIDDKENIWEYQSIPGKSDRIYLGTTMTSVFEDDFKLISIPGLKIAFKKSKIAVQNEMNVQRRKEPEIFKEVSFCFGKDSHVIYFDCSPCDGVEIKITNGHSGDEKKILYEQALRLIDLKRMILCCNEAMEYAKW